MSCDVGKATEGLKMTCDVGIVTEKLENELSNPSVAVTAHSPTLPLFHLRHSSFSNSSFASPTSQALHLRHLASRPWEDLPSVELQPMFPRLQ